MPHQMHMHANVNQLLLSMAEDFYDSVAQALQHQKAFHVVFSGGSTPILFFKTLVHMAQSDVKKLDAWRSICVWMGDERFVPLDHPDSNYYHLKKVLLDYVPVKEVFYIPILGDVSESILDYTKMLSTHGPLDKNKSLTFDKVYLGIGDDGHTLSLFPNQYDPKQTKWVIHTKNPSGQTRISLTPVALEQAKEILFLVLGKQKKPILETFVSSHTHIPAHDIKNKNIYLWTDQILDG